ncbi:uncharacterized protein O3C94_013278 [Discoglossus pictus]
MQIKYQLWCVALVCLLGSQVSGSPTAAPDEDASIIESTINKYVKPYTGTMVEKVTGSAIWNMFGSAVDRVQKTINLSREYVYTYYEDHLKEPKENAMEWIEEKKKNLVDMVQKRFETPSQ